MNPEKFAKIVGLNIAQARTARGMSQAELARQINVSDSAQCRWESGKHIVNLCNLADIHKALGIPLWDLLPTEEDLKEEEKEKKDVSR